MCLVEVGTPMKDRETGEAVLDADGMVENCLIPKPVIGCSTIISEGMHIRTNSPTVLGMPQWGY